MHFAKGMYGFWPSSMSIIYNVEVFGHNRVGCSTALSFETLLGSILFDVIETIITLATFIFPMMKIMRSLDQKYGDDYRRSRSNSANIYYNNDLRNPAIRVFVLTMIALLSTILAVLSAILLSTTLFFAIDEPLNCLCVMLMVSYYDNLYSKCCCGVIRCIESCFRFTSNDSDSSINNDNSPISVTEKENNIFSDEEHETRTLETDISKIKYQIESEMTKTED